MSEAGPEIRTLDSAAGMAEVASVFQRVWKAENPVVNVELLRAVAHAGGYVAAASVSGAIVGASFAFPGRHDGAPTLHSHVTGVLPDTQHRGIGRAIKQHQRRWAAERGFRWITWTFDPLVRRNAWFNIEILGVSVTEYLIDFYGPLADSINAHDETDRVHVAWPTDAVTDRPTGARDADVLRIATPPDIVERRRSDPDGAATWRRRLRDELGGALDRGATIIGFSRDGEYLLRTPD